MGAPQGPQFDERLGTNQAATRYVECSVPETAALLIVARLTVSSSYGQNVERPAGEQFDTVQFYLPGSSDVAYRVRTFALDHDIHVHQIGWPADRANDLVRTHLDRVYGQVLASVDTIALSSRSTQDVRDAGITAGELEVADAGRFAFWNPDGSRYATRSDPADRQGMKEVVYLGGIARFWLPDSWQIEMSPDDGGCFYDPAGSGTLRLNVLTFDSASAGRPPRLPDTLKAGDRPIDGGRLLAGHEFRVYERDDGADGTRLRFWQILQVLPGQCRMYVFSYARPIEDAGTLADELAMVDREIRRMIPYPERVQGKPHGPR
jgi:hypothetical protein